MVVAPGSKVGNSRILWRITLGFTRHWIKSLQLSGCFTCLVKSFFRFGVPRSFFSFFFLCSSFRLSSGIVLCFHSFLSALLLFALSTPARHWFPARGCAAAERGVQTAEVKAVLVVRRCRSVRGDVLNFCFFFQLFGSWFGIRQPKGIPLGQSILRLYCLPFLLSVTFSTHHCPFLWRLLPRIAG